MTYKNVILATGLSLLSLSSAAQTAWPVDLYGRTQKRMGHIGKGTDIHISSVVWYAEGDKDASFVCRNFDHFELVTDDGTIMPESGKDNRGAILFDCVTTQDVWDAAVIGSVLDRLAGKGYQWGQRQEMEMRSRRYVKILRDHGLTYDDPQLMLYLQRIHRRIRPTGLPDARTFHYDLMVVQSPAVDSYMLPDGTIILTTGLLTLLHTQDELAAVMARETAHLVLDHAHANYHKSHLTQIILGALTTLATDAINSFTGFSLSGTSEYYSEGTVTTSDVSLVDGIMTSAVNELGISYSEAQEDACDGIARDILRTSGYDTDALSTALMRLTDVVRSDRRYARTLQKYQAGDMEARAAKAGTPHTAFTSREYENAVASVATVQAQILYNEHRFAASEALARQNVQGGIYTDDDCIILASSLLAVHDDEDAAKETLALTRKAKMMRPENIQAYRPTVLALLRLDRRRDADSTLTQYEAALEDFLKSRDKVRGTEYWEPAYLYTEAERGWIKRTRATIRSESAPRVPRQQPEGTREADPKKN